MLCFWKKIIETLVRYLAQQSHRRLPGPALLAKKTHKEEDMNTAEDIVNDKNQQILTVSFDDTVQTACEFMVGNKIGAVLVEKNEEYVGVWTERDLLRNIADKGFDPKTAKVGNYMSSPLRTAPHDTPTHKLEECFWDCLFVI
jgi:signal-transduction protein with cAMP-binding, CBS, and nucleotidyltransferase domain